MPRLQLVSGSIRMSDVFAPLRDGYAMRPDKVLTSPPKVPRLRYHIPGSRVL